MNSRSAASIAPRVIAAIALGTALTLGTAGCTFITPQSTTIDYAPSDGVNVDATGGDIIVRNAMIIANEDGSTGNLIGVFVNKGDKSARINIDVAGSVLTVRVPAGERVSLGVDEDPKVIENLDTPPGAAIEVLFVSGDGDAEPAAVPVLDGTLEEYADLVPTD